MPPPAARKEPLDSPSARGLFHVPVRTARPGRTPDRSPRMASGTYEVTGSKAVFGIDPGAVGWLDLTAGQAASLIESGHIAPYTEPVKTEPDTGKV